MLVVLFFKERIFKRFIGNAADSLASVAGKTAEAFAYTLNNEPGKAAWASGE